MPTIQLSRSMSFLYRTTYPAHPCRLASIVVNVSWGNCADFGRFSSFTVLPIICGYLR